MSQKKQGDLTYQEILDGLIEKLKGQLTLGRKDIEITMELLNRVKSKIEDERNSIAKEHQTVSDEEIEKYAETKYPITFMDKGQAICDKKNFHDAVIYGAKWMRDKLSKSAEKEAIEFAEWIHQVLQKNDIKHYNERIDKPWGFWHTSPYGSQLTSEELFLKFKKSKG